MAKVEVTMKYIRNNFRKVFRCGYCDLSRILYADNPVYYNAGVYGWNCDVYVNFSRDIAVTTGYRNMTGQRIPSEIIEKYEAQAKAILENFSMPGQSNYETWEEKRFKLEQIAENFWKELDNL